MYSKQIRRQVTQKPTGWKWFQVQQELKHRQQQVRAWVGQHHQETVCAGGQKNGVGRGLMIVIKVREIEHNIAKYFLRSKSDPNTYLLVMLDRVPGIQLCICMRFMLPRASISWVLWENEFSLLFLFFWLGEIQIRVFSLVEFTVSFIKYFFFSI